MIKVFLAEQKKKIQIFLMTNIFMFISKQEKEIADEQKNKIKISFHNN